MEWREPEVVEKIRAQERVDRDVIKKLYSIKNDPQLRGFGFSHGFLVLKSRSSTILGTFFFYALIWSSFIAIVSLVKGPSSRRPMHFFHLYISQYEVQYLFILAGSMALNVAFALFEINSRKRWIYSLTYIFLVLLAPMLFFHWSFLGY